MSSSENQIKELRDIANKLEQLPMFQFFLAGRELFHSNFLFWLFNSRNKEIFEIFGIPQHEFSKVEREKKNIDLTISLKDGRHLYIENKFKAVVDSSQLEKYSNTPETSATGFHVILSTDSFDDLRPDSSTALTIEKFKFGQWKTGGTWYHLGYRELIGALGLISHGYVRDYVNMVNLTLNFIEVTHQIEIQEKRFFWFDHDAKFKILDAIAEQIKIQDMLQKRRAQKFAIEIRTKIEKQGYGNHGIDVRSNFTRKKPLVEAFVNLPGSDFAIGIQLQEDQFRRCFLVQRSKQRSNSTLPLNELKLQGRWFRKNKDDPFSSEYFDKHQDCAKPAKTKGLYQKFGKIFRYQYVKVGKADLQPQHLIDVVLLEIKLAIDIAKDWSPVSTSN